jgi:anti-anti-sigma factor
MSRLVNLEREGQVRIIELALPEQLESVEFDALNDEVRKAIAEEPDAGWVLDLSGVNYMGSSVLGLMVNVRQTIKSAGGRLVLSTMSPRLFEIFRACSLHKLFTITQSREEGVRRARL